MLNAGEVLFLPRGVCVCEGGGSVKVRVKDRVVVVGVRGPVSGLPYFVPVVHLVYFVLWILTYMGQTPILYKSTSIARGLVYQV